MKNLILHIKNTFGNAKILIIIIFNILLLAELQGQVVVKMEKNNGVYSIPCKVNGHKLNFIFDTGASVVSLSLKEAIKMIRLGLIDKSDFLGTKYYQDASGNISEGTKINIKLLEIDKIILKNVEATILKTTNAPLLLGQSALIKLGKIEFDPTKQTFTILDKKLITKGVTYDLFKSITLNENGYIDNFCGFKLLQYEDCVITQFGKPTSRNSLKNNSEYISYGDAYNNLLFILEKLPETTLLKQITSIQLTGEKSNYSVRGIKLGDSLNQISEVFGNPTEASNIKNIYGNAKFVQYDNYNISFELNNNKITSIRVFWGNQNKKNAIENEQLANFKVFQNALLTFKTTEIVSLFAPDFEISAIKGKQNLKFENGFQKDLNSNTKLLSFISDNLKGLKSLLNPKIQSEYSVRFQLVNDSKNTLILPVIKIKNSNFINEIVLKQYFGKLLIWEIN